MKHTMKTLLGVLLALTMACGMLPGMVSTARADYTCPSCSGPLTYDDWWENYYCSSCNKYFYAEDLASPHPHSWSYNANGANVTATCTGSGNCVRPEVASAQ